MLYSFVKLEKYILKFEISLQMYLLTEGYLKETL